MERKKTNEMKKIPALFLFFIKERTFKKITGEEK